MITRKIKNESYLNIVLPSLNLNRDKTYFRNKNFSRFFSSNDGMKNKNKNNKFNFNTLFGNDNINKKFSTKAEVYSENTKSEQIYEYTNASQKLRTLYWMNITYIYGNSVLLYFEMFDPAMGYFHGLMLTLSLTLGWSCLLLLGNVMKNTIHRIHRLESQNKKSKLYKIEYLPFLTKSKTEVIDKTDIVDYTQSNIENFHFFRLRSMRYKKVYINTHKNLYEYKEKLHKEFKGLVSAGLE